MTNWKAVTISLGLAVGWIMGNPAVALGPAPEPQVEVQMNIARVEATVQRERLQVTTTGPVDVVDVAEGDLSGIRRPKGTENPARPG